MECCENRNKQLFFLLLAIQALLIALSIVGKALGFIMMIVMCIILLLLAYFCDGSSWAALFSVFSLIEAVYAFDPVGLFITDGNARTTVQNICCLILFIVCIIASYVGYLYYKSFSMDQNLMQPYENPSNNYSNNNRNNNDSVNSYGGANYFTQNNPSQNNPPQNNNIRRNNNNINQSSSRQRQYFTGQAYSLS